MKDTFNIVKVRSRDDIGYDTIIKKCIDKPNLINYYYPHVFMNRESMDKEEISKIFNDTILSIKRDKNLDHTIKKYNIITNILESLFICVLDIDTIKNLHKLSQFNFAKNENHITEIVNYIIENKPLHNLEQLLNDKIDNSHCVFIIEKIVEHVRNNYNDDILEKKIINNYQILCLINSYIIKLKYNANIIKIINYNKIDLINYYIENCVINENHDKYINNIYEIYEEIISSYNFSEFDKFTWHIYFTKINDSLNIENQKTKILKSLHRLTIIDMIINNSKVANMIKYGNYSSVMTSIINTNKLDVLINNSYINLIKNNATVDKLVVFERIIKYMNNFNSISKDLIKIIIPKYFAKQDIKYYQEIVQRINLISNNKLNLINAIIENQEKFAKDLKITTVQNESKSVFNIDLINLFNIDNKFVESNVGTINKFNKELIGYQSMALKWFDHHYNSLKNNTIHNFLSNGIVQMSNTIIHANLIILNALFLFNESTIIPVSALNNYFSSDIINDIVYTLEYYNLVSKKNDNLILNVSFFETKQTIQIEFIKKLNIVEKKETSDDQNSVSDINNHLVECFIIKTIKTQKITIDDLYTLILDKYSNKIKLDRSIYDVCMKRLFNMDYYEIIDNLICYVP
jgi:hypothetical protein